MLDKKYKPQKQARTKEPQVDPTPTDNLVGFFAQLLEIDKRINPDDYRGTKTYA